MNAQQAIERILSWYGIYDEKLAKLLVELAEHKQIILPDGEPVKITE